MSKTPITDLLNQLDAERAWERKKDMEVSKNTYADLVDELHRTFTETVAMEQLNTLERRFMQVRGIVSSMLLTDVPEQGYERELETYKEQKKLRQDIKNDVDLQLQIIEGLRKRCTDYTRQIELTNPKLKISNYEALQKISDNLVNGGYFEDDQKIIFLSQLRVDAPDSRLSKIKWKKGNPELVCFMKLMTGLKNIAYANKIFQTKNNKPLRDGDLSEGKMYEDLLCIIKPFVVR